MDTSTLAFELPRSPPPASVRDIAIAAPPARLEPPEADDVDPVFEPEVADGRFRALITAPDWTSLPASIRRRFSRPAARSRTIVYAGEVLETWMTRSGWLLAQAGRLIGAPLPTSRCAHVPSVVTVTEEGDHGGQMWTRCYARGARFPQVIHSRKRFAGPTGLEEYVGRGVGMTLAVYAREGALVFRSKDYFAQFLGWKLRLPRWLSPGMICVTHAELPDGKFSFTLQVFRRGTLILRQMAIFRELVS